MMQPFEERAANLAGVIRVMVEAAVPSPLTLTDEDSLAVYAEAFRIVSEDYQEQLHLVMGHVAYDEGCGLVT